MLSEPPISRYSIPPNTSHQGHPKMLRLQLAQWSLSNQNPFLFLKPFVHGHGSASLPITRDFSYKKNKNVRLSFMPGRIKAVATDTEKATSIKAVVTVKLSVGGFFSNLGIDRGLDDIKDLLGQTLLLELVSAELDPKTGLEKSPIKGYAHKASQDANEVKYESSFEVPAYFGEVGAVFVENEHHKEMFLKDIVLDGFPYGSVHVTCNSWIQRKYDDSPKRVFFTNKLYLPSQTASGLRRLREEELVILRGNGLGEHKSSDRIYDYDVYNDLGNPDSNQDLKRPVLRGRQDPILDVAELAARVARRILCRRKEAPASMFLGMNASQK